MESNPQSAVLQDTLEEMPTQMVELHVPWIIFIKVAANSKRIRHLAERRDL
jgi:hypothetical protein